LISSAGASRLQTCSRISAVTVFTLTRQPAARSSAVIRGEP